MRSYDSKAHRHTRLRQDTQPFQRGIIRHVVLILDLSAAMAEKDMRPTRYLVTLKHATTYVREFFEQNPISQLAVMVMHDGLCHLISDLSGNPTHHITAIQSLRNPVNPRESPREPKGNPSLQNALEMARAQLYHTPSHGTREVIIILGALLSLDPGDIHKTIAACARDRLRVSIIGMSGRLKICQEICERTNSGSDASYNVALDEPHLRDLLMSTTTPPAIRSGATEGTAEDGAAGPVGASLLCMGFPSRTITDAPSLCACHGTLSRGGYTCSRCKAKLCSLPATCPACGLTLILSTHLARSYHHLFPLRNWIAVTWKRAREKGTVQCAGCLIKFPTIPMGAGVDDVGGSRRDKGKGREDEVMENGGESQEERERDQLSKELGASESSRYECEACEGHFCIDCDIFSHEQMHNCPGCLSKPAFSTVMEEDGNELANGTANGMNGLNGAS
ncbi:TFIIH basal transcription factor complex, subunit SSL1 [Eremomyces bilateralis CBS 781.70]|uniref:General transcription and DNA repair factor IIH n=1 Tax=Eremomyces bilateralis CBS 781.70 TaxID=1392243 RepID=A0A6G1FW61_9PEZI|nr:TFIIH basal transcription factor complex, subunit SSL1 [Eremomyces bilateralis CBS 781.70]KAF1810013.1 TFIIH basal transcription factor complex, subunit SSL1 [Eremomyces bilateralis CBS 781.70]